MTVRIEKARYERLFAELDDARAVAAVRKDFLPAAHGNDFLTANGDPFCVWRRIVDGDDVVANEDETR